MTVIHKTPKDWRISPTSRTTSKHARHSAGQRRPTRAWAWDRGFAHRVRAKVDTQAEQELAAILGIQSIRRS